mgnify:CR=1 FL=1
MWAEMYSAATRRAPDSYELDCAAVRTKERAERKRRPAGSVTLDMSTIHDQRSLPLSEGRVKGQYK